MSEIIIQRSLTNPQAADALKLALCAVLGNKCTGISAKHGHKNAEQNYIRVHLTSDATAEDENTARQIVLNHDFNERTPEQKAVEAQKARLKELRQANPKVKAQKVGAKAQDIPIADILHRLELAEAEIENLRRHVQTDV